MTFSLLGLSARFKEKCKTSKEIALPAAAAAAAAAAGNNASPGSRPLSNHVPRSCTKLFPNPHSDVSSCIRVYLTNIHIFNDIWMFNKTNMAVPQKQTLNHISNTVKLVF